MTRTMAKASGTRRRTVPLDTPATLEAGDRVPEQLAKVTGPGFGGLLSGLINWIRARRTNAQSSSRLRLAETISLGEKRTVSVIHVEGQRFLIGGSASSVNLLTPLGTQPAAFGDALRRAGAARKPAAAIKARRAIPPTQLPEEIQDTITLSEPAMKAQPEEATSSSASRELIHRVEFIYRSGLEKHKARQFEAARIDFDSAVEQMLSSGMDLKNDRLLAEEFVSLVSRIHALKAAAANQAYAVPSRTPKASPVQLRDDVPDVSIRKPVARVSHHMKPKMAARIAPRASVIIAALFLTAAATMHAAPSQSSDMVTLPQSQETSLPPMRPMPPLAPGIRRLTPPAASADQNQITISGLGSNSPQWTIVVLMTFLTLIPSILICMTPFARLLVVFHFLRQALGLQTTPSNQTLVGLSLIMTFFLMQPVGKVIYDQSIVPMQSGQITAEVALDRGIVPMRQFMAHYVREKDVALFLDIAKEPHPATINDVSLRVLLPAYVLSELKSGFQIGAVLFLPFLVVDMIVASITTSVGMMQLPPVVISTPLKLLLFLMVDGWHLLIGSLMRSFY
jgi:flagellar biosynthetic protein FliP